MNKLTVRNAEIVFANLKDEGYGTSLTVKVTPEIEKELIAFYAENKIGNEKTVIGVPNFKEYEGTKQISLKINDSTKFHYMNGLSAESLGFGANIDFVLNAFEYNNKFTKGKTYIGASVSAVVVKTGRKTGADADMADLLGGVVETIPEDVQQVEGNGLPF